LAFKAAANIPLGSATVSEKPPVETSKIPTTLLALFGSKTLNCNRLNFVYITQL
jgi:hypothetical protein